MPRFSLIGCPICITGASAGIGRATALACARAGMPVVVTARRRARLDELVETIHAAGGRAVAETVDVTNPDDCARMVERCLGEFGSIHAVFANAGFGLEYPTWRTPDATARDIFETNYFGTLNTIKPALPHLIAQGRGHVLICSSSIGKIALPYNGDYCATKGAQWLVGRAMNLELRPHGVFVSTVHPIGTTTEFTNVTQQHSADAETNAGADANARSAPPLKHAPDFMLQPPEKVARGVVRCLRRPRREVWTSQFVRLSIALTGAFPVLADFGVRTMVREWERTHPAAKR